jgi:hypothetical protein
MKRWGCCKKKKKIFCYLFFILLYLSLFPVEFFENKEKEEVFIEKKNVKKKPSTFLSKVFVTTRISCFPLFS